MDMDMELTILLLDIYKDMIQMSRSSKSLFFFNQTLDCWNHSDTSVAGRLANVQFANVLRRFTNMFSSRDSKVNLFKKLGILKFGNFDPLRMITAS